jgi:hypothetical protein
MVLVARLATPASAALRKVRQLALGLIAHALVQVD